MSKWSFWAHGAELYLDLVVALLRDAKKCHGRMEALKFKGLCSKGLHTWFAATSKIG